MPTVEVAEKAGMLEHYKSFYRVTSDYAHSNVPALNRHIELNGEEGISQINHGPSDSNVIPNLVAMAEFTLSAIADMCKLLKVDENSKILCFDKRIKELF